MKRFLTTAASAVMLLAACDNVSVSFRPVVYDNAFALEDGAQDSLTVSVDIEYPAGPANKVSQAMTDAITGSLLGSSYVGMEPYEAASAWADSLASEYRESNLELLSILEKDGDQGPSMGMNWTTDKQGKMTGTYKDVISYRTATYTYTGGAHGSTWEANLNFDRKSGKLLEQEDVFAEGFEGQVRKLLMKHLNDGRDENSQISLLVDEIEPNGNFTIGPEGITFTYNQYEIAAYVFGIIDILIPAEEIKPYLKAGTGFYD